MEINYSQSSDITNISFDDRQLDFIDFKIQILNQNENTQKQFDL